MFSFPHFRLFSWIIYDDNKFFSRRWLFSIPTACATRAYQHPHATIQQRFKENEFEVVRKDGLVFLREMAAEVKNFMDFKMSAVMVSHLFSTDWWFFWKHSVKWV